MWDFVARRRRGAAPLRLRRREIRPVAPSRAARLLGARDEPPRAESERDRARRAASSSAPRATSSCGVPAFVLLERRLRRRVAAALRGAAAAGSSCQTICLGSLDYQPAAAIEVGVGSESVSHARRAAGSLRCRAAANVQQSKWAARWAAPRKRWTERAARSYRYRACEASGGRLVALAPMAQNPSSLSKVWLCLGTK